MRNKETTSSKIFLNASSTGEDVSEELRAFLKYIKDQTIDSKFVEKINEEVKQIKESREWRREYMSLYAHDCDVMERGIERGEYLNTIKLIMKKHGKMNSNDLAQFLECDEKLVSEIFGVMDDKNGQVSAEELYEVLFNHK